MPVKYYYDTIATGTTATELTFFAHSEPEDGETVTNLPSPGRLDTDFTLKKIIIRPASDLTRADELKLSEKAVIKLIVAGNEILKVPVTEAMSAYRFSTEGTVGSGEVISAGNPAGGLTLEEPVVIPANTGFSLKLILDSAFSTDTNITCILVGTVA